ncbi:LysR family transcriptional regulator [Streptomyces griseorubiginosus]|uniref:HTH-type transcriptional regulator LeuO n=1 Tax=Streptomyces griseorubiginosus TaxID=67304 RepID=A0AAI8L8K3_9ACTN|nr:LysR family transcriptional regulator [Streptomyces griseorubiginosus]AYC43271.1 HTH-type transcriptional regulator LeuO [Streptomyces griseorubiginosus]
MRDRNTNGSGEPARSVAAPLDLNLLRTFLTVHRTGSFTAAARLLGLSQPTVTTQIRSLERQLGHELFERQARGVTPAPHADELAARIVRPLDELAAVAGPADGADDAPAEPVHLAGPAELLSRCVLPGLSPLVDAGVRLRITPGLTEPLLEDLRAGRHDLVIATFRPRGRALTALPLTDEEFVLVTSPTQADRLASSDQTERLTSPTQARRLTSPARADQPGTPTRTERPSTRAERPRTPAPAPAEQPHTPTPTKRPPSRAERPGTPARLQAALHAVPLVAYAEDLPIVRRYWRHVFGGRLVRQPEVTMPDLNAVKAAVVGGTGFTVLPRYLCAAELASGSLVLLHDPEDPPINTSFLVQRPGTSGNPHVAVVRDHLLAAASDW